ncbi:hypothetical protein ACFQV4_27270 [Streptomyces thermocarboxydus]
MRDGRRTGPRATLAACRDRLSADLAVLPPQAAGSGNPSPPRDGLRAARRPHGARPARAGGTDHGGRRLV